MQRSNALILAIGIALAAMFSLSAHARAQAIQTTGTPCSPAATTTVDGRYLPNPAPPFGGVMNPNAKDSKPCWPPRIVPPKGAPNILLIMTDDAGYGISSTFGGVIPTPALDRLAKVGLRYTQFHSTALCSPTRAAIITGRNHHSAGYGVVAEQATGYPGYNSIIGVDNATIGEILKQNGYATSWFGKDHNTPDYQYSIAGPYDQWPLGMGFEYFYGFLGGETDQWTPFLFRNTTQIFPWRDDPSYNLVTGMADDAIHYLRELNASAPDKPFFLYYVPGATHAPHHPTKEWIDKIAAMHLFDKGWNALREQIFENQKRLGVIPPNTKLTDWPDGQPEFGGAKLPRWETLTADEKKLFVRQADVFAAYVAYNDHEIGRVIGEVAAQGKLDNTIIFYITGDNGTSPEGSLNGTPFDLAALQTIEVPVKDQLRYIPVWGGPETQPHMSVAWAWAFDTPFKWTKEVASYFGGTRQGMVISWPGHINDPGGIRTQFSHVIDVVPTILEATGIPAPVMVKGVAQKPIEGTSMVYTFDKANASTPSRHRTQYFEIWGNRAMYQDGWIACTIPPGPPWNWLAKMPGDAMNGYQWELFNVADDYSESSDLSAKYPDKLRALKELFTVEATRYNVFPLDNSITERVLSPRPSAIAGRTEFTYTGELTGIPSSNAPNILDKSYTITAEVEVPTGGGEGMIVTHGGRFGGYGLYLLKGKPIFLYNFLALERFRWEGTAPLAAGKHTLVFDFRYDGPGPGKGGAGTLTVDGKLVATKAIPRTIPFILPFSETLDLGADTRTGLDDNDYKVPFRFTGKINKVTIKIGPEQLTEEDQKAKQQAFANANN